MPPSGGAARHPAATRSGELRAPSGAPRSTASGAYSEGSSYTDSSYYSDVSESLAPPPPPPQPKAAKKPLLSWFRRKAAAEQAQAPPTEAQDVSAPERSGPQEVQTRPDWPPLPTPEERAAKAAAEQAAAEAKAAEEAALAPAVPAAVLSMRARGRPDDGHLAHLTRAEREEAEAAAAAAAADEAAAAAPPPPPPTPKATEVVAAFIAASEVVAETNARFTSACDACRALQTALGSIGPTSEGFTEVVVAREALSGALATRRNASSPFSGADAEVCPPLLPLLAAATARCEAALDRSAVRVIRGAEARALWRHALGSAPDAPWPVFAAGLQAFLRAAPEPRARFVLERVCSPSGDARLRWHVDRGNSDAVSTAAVDAAFPPDAPLLARLEALLDAAPDKATQLAALHTTLPPRQPAGALAPREAHPGALGDRLLTERGLRGLALVGGAGMGKTALAVDEAHILLAANRLPGGAYFADLRGRVTRPACGAALAHALAAPPLGGPDPEGAALAALRQAGARGTALLVLDGCDAALAEGGGGEFYALLSRVLSCGEHVRLLLTSRAPVESGLAGVRPHRVGALPLKSCIDALTACFPPHAELSDPAQSRHFAKEAAQLAGRAPLALALNAATLGAAPQEQRGAALGALLHALRVARGVKFEGADTGSACVNCALTNPWDHVLEFLAPSAYYDTAGAAKIAAQEEAALAAAAAAGAAAPQSHHAEFERAGDATIAGLKVPEYEAAIKACAATAWAALTPAAKAAAPALSVFPASFDAHAAMAVLAEAPGVPPTEAAAAIQLLLDRRLLSFDARAGRYSMASLVRKAMGETPLGAAALQAAAPVFVRYLTAQTADAEADAAAGQPSAGLYETDREWHNLFEATAPWGLAGGADAELAAAINALREAHERVVAARAKPSDKPMDVAAGDAVAQVANLTAFAEQLAAKGSYDESLKAYQEALDLQVTNAGGYDPSLAATHSAMAFIRAAACDDAAAVRDLQRALAIQTLALGPSHPDLGATLVDLANAQRKTGALDEAAASGRRALALLADARGEDHVDVAVAYNALGNVYKAQGLMAEALDSYRLALRIREAALGPKALDVANTLWNIACCYELQERYTDANAVLVRAVRIYQAELGPDHDETLEAMKFAARMGEAKRIAKGGDEPWKSDHKGHPWSRMQGTL